MMFVSEEGRIAERIKEYMKSKKYYWSAYTYIMLRNGRILHFINYTDMVDAGKINPMDACVYIGIYRAKFKADFHYPLLGWYDILLNAYLSKSGFYYGDHVVPATGLRYVASGAIYGEYLAIEVSNLDTVVNNTNLRTITFEVLGAKLVSGERELTGEEYDKTFYMFTSQRLFAGYTSGEAYNIIYNYYNNGNQSLAKEVARITIDYDRIFQPYRVCYDIKTWKEIDCLSIKL